MKRIVTMATAFLFVFSLGITAMADYDTNTDYMAVMIESATQGDVEKGTQAQACRDEKIAEEELEFVEVSFEDLYLIAKIIHSEAGSEWLSDEWKMAVGEVIINRVASPEFPDTVREVVEAPGQYYGSGSSYFSNLKPSERCVIIAQRLLDGERFLNEPSVVFQSNGVQGSGVYLHLKDDVLGSTYFCYSNHMDLYQG